MADKKALMTGDVKDFLAVMNPEKECKRKSSSTARNFKRRHHKTND
jgi:hypothetical protein